MSDVIGKFEVIPFPRRRLGIIDLLDQAMKRHRVMGLLDMDITIARNFINAHKEKTGETISLTAWALVCISKAISEYKEIHSYRKGRRKLVIFDDVDISILIERVSKDKRFFAPYILRKANEKTMIDIHNEIRDAQKEDIGGKEVHILGRKKFQRKAARVINRLPKFFRNLIARRLRKDPFFAKRMSGTVGVTSLRMFNKTTGWAIPMSIYPINIAIGGVGKKPAVVGDEIKIREFMSVTIQADHDVMDGGPTARFVSRLLELVENGYGLNLDIGSKR
jgi:pyruvate/2-oxoglutarate dehydrogenase complex dihydrolipoamide acyltransferase (E2) component